MLRMDELMPIHNQINWTARSYDGSETIFVLSRESRHIEITIKAKYRQVATLSRDQAILENARDWHYWSLFVQYIIPSPHRFAAEQTLWKYC